MNVPHAPVMLGPVLAALAPKDGDMIVDATFGAGGYSRAILQAAACRVIALDRDPSTHYLADALARDFPGHFLFLAARFSQMREALAGQHVTGADGIVLDIGVSSMQLDTPQRGFSFRVDGPLDMRMSDHGRSAADIVREAGEQELAHILFTYGEEREARRIARAIVAARQITPITSTLQLAEIIRGAVRAPHASKIHPATRSFQALRIEVNQELQELSQALSAAEHLLRPGGRLVVVTFHSLEDRVVKDFMLQRSSPARATSRFSPAALQRDARAPAPTFTLPFRRPITPAPEEVQQNPRARSAKLRCAFRTASPLAA